MTRTNLQTWTGLAIAASALVLVQCSGPAEEETSFETLVESGELVVLTLDGPTIHERRDGAAEGFEVDLVSAFADEYGLSVRFRVMRDIGALIDALENGEGHLAAANLTINEARAGRITFGPAYKNVRERLVCRRGGESASTVEDLAGLRLAVVEDSSYADTLRQLQQAHPGIEFDERPAGSAMPLLEAVDQGSIDCTIADSHLVTFARRRHPELITPLNLSEESALAWAHSGRVEGLAEALDSWFAEAHAFGLIEEIEEDWFGDFGAFDYVETARFVRRVDNRLPRFRNYFRDAAEDTPFDWELLAAQAYQESHWDPDAESPTGVRGLMMLTLPTAERVGVTDRLDPRQSVEGGAAYLADLYDRLPDGIEGDDRLWFALAAYNVGMGHIYDARLLAERQGRDKNSWEVMEEVLPLLTRPEYYSTVRYGYARGHEPVRYVERVRTYRAMLEANLR
ncbi:membrane-bound lytic murein transglycosylase MltF [Hyphobacterium sp. HN65]|uniref:Membrane-bound lytic murein transglycosylase F n=1 Tax=Hyphobacterium lacteum TaxID=3116575 RepID=A0ABU7LNZ8_9PROT|nr:membrane-bound lytic murein transglycosylase MltF [Hyphobacterium sp. HN65]MEE2525636.1 membrane-bound lytic murein transglycosylase MltF [Hyphobacterium sp. HN65]